MTACHGQGGMGLKRGDHTIDFLAIVTFVIIGSWTCRPAQGELMKIADVLADDPRLSVISKAADGLLQHLFQLVNKPPYTLIAPTNKAFEDAFHEGSIACGIRQTCKSPEMLLSSPARHSFVLRHVFEGRHIPEGWLDGQVLKAINGAYVKVEKREGWPLRIGNAELTTDNSLLVASDGVVVVVNAILMDYSHLDTSIVEAGERIIGIGPFSGLQRRILVEEVSEHLQCYRKIRALGLQDGGSHDPSALVFAHITHKKQAPLTESVVESSKEEIDTRVHYRGLRERSTAPAQNNGLNGADDGAWALPDNVKRPERDEDLAFMTVLQLASLLRRGLVTSMELTDLYLSRLKRYDEALEVVITYTEQLAKYQALHADKEIQSGIFRSILHGIPYGLKDLISVPSYPTTWGAGPFSDQVLDEAAWPYQKLRDAGAVLVVKLATGAMAWGDVWFNGRTKNPWNIAEGSCGSSSGSGAATCAGLLPFAIGTETWGSISCPAETMGVTGYRPTFGTVGRTGVMTLSPSLDKIGTFCRQAMDCAAIMDTMRGEDPDDLSSIEVPPIRPSDVDVPSMRVGFTREANFEVVTNLSSLGITMIPVDLNYSVPADSVINIVLGSEAGAFFDNWLRSNASDTMREQHKWPAYIRSARFIPAVEYIQANRARMRLMEEIEGLLSGLDAVLVPARYIGNQNGMGNVAGIPQVVFPVGFESVVPRGAANTRRKDPKTQALIGLPFSDSKILAITSAYQNLTEHHLMRPPIDDVEKTVKRSCLPFSRCSTEKHDQNLTEGGSPEDWDWIGGND